jgi:hypothetical protein
MVGGGVKMCQMRHWSSGGRRGNGWKVRWEEDEADVMVFLWLGRHHEVGYGVFVKRRDL